MNRRPRCPGFTMIELMVVIAIIAVLISLLLPAVQASREAARRTQCASNLLQLGLALGSYEATHQVLPPGVVNPAGPVVESVSGYQFGWIVQLLPFFEQRNVAQNVNFNVGVYHVNNLTVRGVSMSVLLCPSTSFGRNSSTSFGAGSPNSPLASLPSAARSSYAACHNDVEAPIDANNKGVFFLNSHIRLDEIEDGLSHTIFLGEKRPGGDELGWASGTRATLRNTGTWINQTELDPTDLVPLGLVGLDAGPVLGAVPRNPQPAPATPMGATPVPVGGFGSLHPGGSNFVFGDGSVRFLRTSLDFRIFQLLGNRADGDPIGDDQL